MFGFLVFIFGLMIGGQDPDLPLWFVIPMVPLSFIIFYFAMKHTVFDLVDAVFDEGESLLIRNKNREERISLSDIDEVSYAPFGARMTLTLKRLGTFGTEIAFLPLMELLPFVKNPAVRRLIKKIKERGTALS
jgi:hypothetical protein